MKLILVKFIFFVVCFALWSCSGGNEVSSSFKNSLTASAQTLSTAIDKVRSSGGFQVLSVSSGSTSEAPLKSPALQATATLSYDSIKLKDINGIYDYKPSYKKGSFDIQKLFVKTDGNPDMIVRLPESKVSPASLTSFVPTDTILANNYKIDLSDYFYKFKSSSSWSYRMMASINIKNVDVGTLAIVSSNSMSAGYKYASDFVFPSGYKISCSYITGDTATATYTFKNGSTILYAESFQSIKASEDNAHHENSYSIIIGDVNIVRSYQSGEISTVKVYLKGIEQTNCTIEFKDSDKDESELVDNSLVSENRDLKITFDDGTQVSLSDLLGSSISSVRSLFGALRKSTFAVSIVDRIAWDIYSNK